MSNIKGIQMIGTQRSGSNLLRVMLDGVGCIFAPHPPHSLQRFIPLLPKYGDLTNEQNFQRLAADVCELVRINPVPWEGVNLDTAQITSQCRTHTLFELFRVIYEEGARQRHADFWLNKSMKNAFFIDGIENTGVHPFYLYLHRDGRDVALSFSKAIVGEKHVYNIAKNWKKDQEEALRLKAHIPADRFISVAYETLIANPEATLRTICDKLGVPYSDQCLNYYKSSESAHTATAGKMWQNVSRPIMKDNTKKFLREMTPEQIAIFESVAGDTLQKLGYELVTPAEKLRDSFTEEEITRFEAENEQLKKIFRNQQADPDDLEKRRPQDELIARIKNYTVN